MTRMYQPHENLVFLIILFRKNSMPKSRLSLQFADQLMQSLANVNSGSIRCYMQAESNHVTFNSQFFHEKFPDSEVKPLLCGAPHNRAHFLSGSRNFFTDSSYLQAALTKGPDALMSTLKASPSFLSGDHLFSWFLASIKAIFFVFYASNINEITDHSKWNAKICSTYQQVAPNRHVQRD